MYLRIPYYCDACLNSSLLHVGVKMLLNTIVMILLVMAELCEQAITSCGRISIFLEGFLNAFRLLLVVGSIMSSLLLYGNVVITACLCCKGWSEQTCRSLMCVPFL